MSRFLALAIGAGLILSGWAAGARAQRLSETEVKAAMVTNVLLFMQWPAPRLTAETYFHLCTMDAGPLTQALERSTGMKVQSVPMIVLPLDKSMSQIHLCEALVVDTQNPHNLARVAAATRGQPILVIAEGEQSLQGGAMIVLANSGNRVVFDVNLPLLRAAGLTVSSKLLRLARSVVE